MMMFGVSSECCFYSFLSFFRPSVFLSRIYLACKGTQTRHLFTTHKAGILLKTVRMQTFRLTWCVPFFHVLSLSLAYILLLIILSMLSYVCDLYTHNPADCDHIIRVCGINISMFAGLHTFMREEHQEEYIDKMCQKENILQK